MITAPDVQSLATSYVSVTRAFYKSHGLSRDNLYTALNAIAYATATILVGTKGEAMPFFDNALKTAITELVRTPKPKQRKQTKRRTKK